MEKPRHKGVKWLPKGLKVVTLGVRTDKDKLAVLGSWPCTHDRPFIIHKFI